MGSMSTLAPLRYRSFRLLISARAVNALGSSFAPIALAFAVLDLTGSAGDLGLVVAARTLPNVVFLLFGGVLADRLPKHRLMVLSCVAAAVTQAAVAALVLTDSATVPLLIGFALVNGTVSALSLPASAAILPLTVPADIRQQANALSRLSLNGAAIIGAPTGGIVVAGIGPGWGILVDAVSFAIAALLFALLRPPAAPATADVERPHIFADLRTGWSEFRSRTWLWAVVAGFCVLNACSFGGLSVLGPVVADDTIGRRAWGLVLAAETAGLIVGGLIAIRLRLRRLLFVGVASCFFMAGPVLVLGLYPRVGALLAAAFVAGLMVEQFGVAWETTMQEHIPGEKLARVYSYDMVGSFLAIPVGQVVVGPVASGVGLKPTLIGTAVLMILAVLGMLSSRDVRTLPHKLPEPGAAPMKESLT
jgi:MFS family permease